MRVLRALSIVAGLCMTHGVFACEIHTTSYEASTELELIAPLNEPVLLNYADASQAERLQAELAAPLEEPILLNREDLIQVEASHLAEEVLQPTWDMQDIQPSTVAFLVPPHLQVVVDDGGIPLIDVEHTGSNGINFSAAWGETDELALDGFEDR